MKVLVVDVCGTHGGLGNGVCAITIITLSEAQPRVVVLEPLVAGRNIPWFLGASADLRPTTMVSTWGARPPIKRPPGCASSDELELRNE